jgi:hypothetical protein
MASIHREVILGSAPVVVWDALRDIGALHTRMVPGFVVDTKLETGARIVTFANGMVVRELILDVDEQRRRVAWATVGTQMLSHYSASFQLFDAGGGRTRGVWIADLLPDEAAPAVATMIEEGLLAMNKAFG